MSDLRNKLHSKLPSKSIGHLLNTLPVQLFTLPCYKDRCHFPFFVEELLTDNCENAALFSNVANQVLTWLLVAPWTISLLSTSNRIDSIIVGWPCFVHVVHGAPPNRQSSLRCNFSYVVRALRHLVDCADVVWIVLYHLSYELLYETLCQIRWS